MMQIMENQVTGDLQLGAWHTIKHGSHRTAQNGVVRRNGKQNRYGEHSIVTSFLIPSPHSFHVFSVNASRLLPVSESSDINTCTTIEVCLLIFWEAKNQRCRHPQVLGGSELIAADESDEAVFVGFCGKMTKLTNIRTLNLGIFWLQVLKTLKTVSSLCTLLTLWARVTCSSLVCPTSTLLPHIRRSQSRVFSTSVSVYQFQVYLWEKRHWWPW
ncbi:Uncharacterized protein Rs2_06724 [Raphanus sativus]|nr:Uncharacterized protein Rs2_06724 [Raphanus sativus]